MGHRCPAGPTSRPKGGFFFCFEWRAWGVLGVSLDFITQPVGSRGECIYVFLPRD